MPFGHKNRPCTPSARKLVLIFGTVNFYSGNEKHDSTARMTYTDFRVFPDILSPHISCTEILRLELKAGWMKSVHSNLPENRTSQTDTPQTSDQALFVAGEEANTEHALLSDTEQVKRNN